MPRKTRSVQYADDNMGQHGSNKVQLKDTSEKSKVILLNVKEKDAGKTKLKSAKLPLREKNIAQTVTSERRLSVRQGAKKSADKITEFCRKIKNSKPHLDKENSQPKKMLKITCHTSSTLEDKNKVKNVITEFNKTPVEKPINSHKRSDNNIFASPRIMPQSNSNKTPLSDKVQPAIRRLSVREGARKSKDKIAEFCRAIKNPKNVKTIENLSSLDVDNITQEENKVLTNNTEEVTIQNTNLITDLPPLMKLRRRRNTSLKENSQSKVNKNSKDEQKKKTKIIKNIIKDQATPQQALTHKGVKSVLRESNTFSDNNNINKSMVKIKRAFKPTKDLLVAEEKENDSPRVLKRKCITSPLGKTNAKRIIYKDFSFRLLETKKTQETVQNKETVYEFTFDPSEEPPAQKKKRKQVARKKPKPQAKPVSINNNYDKNISKKLQILKESVNKKNTEQKANAVTKSSDTQEKHVKITKDIKNQLATQGKDVQKTIEVTKSTTINTNVSKISEEQDHTIGNLVELMDTAPALQLNDPEPILTEVVNDAFPDISAPNNNPQENLARNDVEDLEAQWGPSLDNEKDLNYSPVRMSFNNVLSSTLNTSIRQPQESPWRTDFESLPFKWQANSYLKSNMTPALETSFVISDKKHVYTNMLPEDDTPPEIEEAEKGSPKLKQTSITSFVENVSERTTRRNRNQRKVNGPSRANLPLTALNFAPSFDVVNKLYSEMKGATEAPEVPERNDDGTNVEPAMYEVNEENEGSVHLFEDIDVVHHLKPTRKSYGKAKKLTLCTTVVDNTAQPGPEDSDSDTERQALDDLTFDLPHVKTRKVAKKKKGLKLTKKEVEEVEAWAAAFNSMCEDVEDFPLLTE